MTCDMDTNSMHERPGLHIGHLRQLVRLRRAGGWLGFFALIAALAMYQLHRDEPALFESAHGYTMHEPPTVTAGHAVIHRQAAVR